jgi:acyl-CoA synthetase (AMP-forming)/AMP-acid ligase II
MAVIDGAMQHFSLTVDKFIEHAAKWHPGAEVVTAQADGALLRGDYASLRLRALRVSAALADLGVSLGDRVATLAWNTGAHLEAWYGIMNMGATCHTLNPRLMAEQTAAMLVQSGARVLIVSADLLPLARQIAEAGAIFAHVLVIDGEFSIGEEVGGVAAESWEPAILDAPQEVTWGNFDENLSCGLCFTSGTTGAPKGVTYTHRGNYLHALRLLQADVLGLTAADTVLTAVPMFHANAWGIPFAAPAVGARLVLPGRRTDGASLARLIESEGVTIAVGVPTVWLGLLDHLDAEGGDTPSLQRILIGGAPLPPSLKERIERRLGANVQMSWGMTELSPTGTVTPPHDIEREVSRAGRPALGIDLLLTDGDGRPLPEQRGAEGHLRVRGGAVIDRYAGDRQSATDADGWFDTGDLARIDAEGNLTITGRAKDLIKSGGEWINPAQIEAIVCELPEVSLAAVIGRADAKWGERPVLVVEMQQDHAMTDEKLLAPLQGRVASWWIPDQVVRLSRMPLASTGKIDKMRLRAEYSCS